MSGRRRLSCTACADLHTAATAEPCDRCRNYDEWRAEGSHPLSRPAPSPPPASLRTPGALSELGAFIVLGGLDALDANLWIEAMRLDREDAVAVMTERQRRNPQCAFGVFYGKLDGVADLVTLARKLDEANATIAELRAEIERLRPVGAIS
jgi:hypothetical protein